MVNHSIRFIGTRDGRCRSERRISEKCLGIEPLESRQLLAAVGPWSELHRPAVALVDSAPAAVPRAPTSDPVDLLPPPEELSAPVIAFSPLSPPGALIHRASASDAISTADEVDSVSFTLDAGQIISIVVQPDASLQPRATLRGPDFTFSTIGQAAATAAGETVRLQTQPAAASGTYTVEVDGQGGTTGSYSLGIFLNAAAEDEEYGGAANDAAAQAQDIDESFIPSGALERGAVVGAAPASDPLNDDWYRFTLTDGQVASAIVAAPGSFSGVRLEVLHGSDTPVVVATSKSAEEDTHVIHNLVDQTSDGIPDVYYVRVIAPDTNYTLVVTRDGDFDTDPNGAIDRAQQVSPQSHVLGHVDDQSASALNLIQSFSGPSFTGFIPPDPIVAAGPQQIVTLVNTQMAIYDKATGAKRFQQNISGPTGFFGNVGATTTVFDPWVIFDTDSDRFFVVGIDIASSTQSNVFLAVSTNSTPVSGTDWHKYRMDFTHLPPPSLGSQAHFPDYEKLGVNDVALFLSANYFPIDTGSGVYAGITVLAKEPLLNGGPANIVFQDFFAGFSVFPLNQFASGSTEYFAEARGSGILRIHAVVDPLGTPQRHTFDLPVPAYDEPQDVPQPGAVRPVHAIDSRIMTGVWRNGSAWSAHAIRDPAVPDGETLVRWYEVNTNGFPLADPTLVQSGNVDPGPGQHAWMPALAVDGNGNMGIGFSFGGAAEFAGAAFTGRLAGDPPGATTLPVNIYAPGQGTYQLTDSFGRNRWGDYSGLAIDPADDRTFWVFNEFATSNNRWATQIGSFQIDPIAESDFYSFDANADDVLVIETSTPFDGPDQPLNVLDPAIELFGPDGVLISADDNSAVDSRNARLTHTVLQSGNYRVRVLPVASRGTYALSVSGLTAADSPPVVANVTPGNDQVLNTFPTSVVVQFSEYLFVPSIQPDDLTINDIPASGVTVTGNVLIFGLGPAVNTGDGVYRIHMAAGAVSDLGGNPTATPLETTFTVDREGPRILSTSWNGQPFPATTILPPGPLAFEAAFSEPLFIAASPRRGALIPGVDDIVLVDTSTRTVLEENAVTFDVTANQLLAGYDELPEGTYMLTLASGVGAFEDHARNALDGEPLGPAPDGTPTGDGTPGGHYTIDFIVDGDARPARPFQRLEPLGALLSLSTGNRGYLHAPSDQDGFTFFAHQGQVLTATLTLDAPGTATIEVVGLAGPFSSARPGGTVFTPAFTIPADGVYELRVTGDRVFHYSLDILLNTLNEARIGDSGAGNQLPLDDAAVPLASRRFAVVGRTDTSLAFVRHAAPDLFLDISSTGTPLNLADDAEVTITTTVGNEIFPAGPVTVGNNGGIIAGEGGQLFSVNFPLPTGIFGLHLGTALLPYWDDLDDPTGNVFWEERVIDETNTLIVQWDNRSHFETPGTATFQLQLFDSGRTLARFAYQDVVFGSPQFNRGASATIGYQENDSQATQFSFNTASVENGDVLDLVKKPDVDEYTLDLSGLVGQQIDVLLAGLDGVRLSNETLELLDPDGNVRATATSSPLGSPVSNYDLGILSLEVPDIGNNIYTLRFESFTDSEYSLVIVESLVFDSEPNNDAATDSLRSLEAVPNALGYLDALDPVDLYPVQVPADQILQVTARSLFDNPAASPLNDLNVQLSLIATDGTVVAENLDGLDGKNARLVYTNPVKGSYTIRVQATSGGGEYLLETTYLPPGDTVPPIVMGVFVRGSGANWSQSFLSELQAQGLGDAELGFAIGTSATPGEVLPWTKIDQVSVVFSEDVVVDSADFALHGVQQATYPLSLTGGFNYDRSSFTAIWKLQDPLGIDKLLIHLGDSITDLAGNGLVGSRPEGTSAFPPEDGSPVDNLDFRFDVLPGDTSQSGTVAVSDVAPLRIGLGTAVGGANYSLLADLDASGGIAVSDVIPLRANLGRRLPDGEPILPTAPQSAMPSAAAIDRVLAAPGSVLNVLDTVESSLATMLKSLLPTHPAKRPRSAWIV